MRKKKDYLPKLLEYIDLANKIPRTFNFPQKGEVSKKTSERLNKKSVSREEIIETFEILLEPFPQDLFDFVFTTSSTEDWEKLEEIRKKVDLLSSISYGLKSLAFFVTIEYLNELEEEDEENYDFFDIGYAPHFDLNESLQEITEDLPEYVADLTVGISVNNEGILQLATTEFYNLITQNKIEARRIRQCLICQNVFWATRIDKWTCSQACGNILRQRNWQKQNKDEYNEKRRKNYAYSKSIKNKKESE